MALELNLPDRDPDSFDVRGTLRRLVRSTKRFRGTVLLTCLLTIGLVALYVRLWPPVYMASASIMAEREFDAARDQFYVNWNVFRKEDPRTEIELMTAGPILAEVIEVEHLSYNDVYHPFMSHAVYLWETSPVGRAYRAIKRGISGKDDTGSLTPAQVEFAKTINDFHSGISVEPVGESNVGRVTVKGPTRRVADIANTLVKVYLARRVDRHVDEARQSLDILSAQNEGAASTLRAAEQRRLAFSNRHALAFDFQKDSLQVAKLTDLESSIAQSRSRVAAIEASLSEIDRQLISQPDMKTTSTVTELNSVREGLKIRRLELQGALIQARDRYREDSPEVQEIQRSLAKLEGMENAESERVERATTRGVNPLQQDLIIKRGSLETELAGTRAGLAVIEQTAQAMRPRMAAVPALQSQLKDIDRDVTIAQEKYQGILLKRAQADISVATARAATPSLHVVEYASPPANVYWPKTKYLYLAAIALGLLLGVFLAQLRAAMSGVVRREDFEDGTGPLPLYAMVKLQPWTNPFHAIRRDGSLAQ